MADSIVVDATVPIRAVLDRDDRAIQVLRAWAAEGVGIVAPDLWRAEAITAVRRALAAGAQPADSGDDLLDDLFALPVKAILTDRDLASAALRWAERLGQTRAYDALYLAVAERHEATLITTDERLLNRCRQLGIDFVEGLPDAAV